MVEFQSASEVDNILCLTERRDRAVKVITNLASVGRAARMSASHALFRITAARGGSNVALTATPPPIYAVSGSGRVSKTCSLHEEAGCESGSDGDKTIRWVHDDSRKAIDKIRTLRMVCIVTPNI